MGLDKTSDINAPWVSSGRSDLPETVKIYSDYYREISGENYDAHVAWALNLIMQSDVSITRATTVEEREKIEAQLERSRELNTEFFEKAEAFIASAELKQARQADAETTYLANIRKATDALANGDKDAYEAAERALIDTSPIDIAAVRQRIAEDALNND